MPEQHIICEIDVGQDPLSLRVVYDRAAWWDAALQVHDAVDLASRMHQFITAWDLQDDTGHPMPITAGRVGALPASLSATILNAIAKHERAQQATLSGATRQFESAGVRLVGSMAIAASVYVFDDDAMAEAAVPIVVEQFQDNIATGTAPLQPASPADIGENAVAFAGELANQNNPDTPFQAGLFAWREGPVVYLILSAGLSGDQLSEAFAVARAITGRTMGDGPIVTPADGIRTGGMWDLLPTLDDVPEGFVFKSEGEIAK